MDPVSSIDTSSDFVFSLIMAFSEKDVHDNKVMQNAKKLMCNLFMRILLKNQFNE